MGRRAPRAEADLRRLDDPANAAKSKSQNAEVHLLRGRELLIKGDTKGALQEFDEMVRTEPRSTLAYSNRALAYQAAGEADKSIADWTKAVQLDPKMAVAWFGRALAAAQKNELSSPCRLPEAKRLDPHVGERANRLPGVSAEAEIQSFLGRWPYRLLRPRRPALAVKPGEAASGRAPTSNGRRRRERLRRRGRRGRRHQPLPVAPQRFLRDSPRTPDLLRPGNAAVR